jgi:hypothetical protein
VVDADDELAPRRSGRTWLITASVAMLAIAGIILAVVIWRKRKADRETVIVEEVTSSAFGCVAAIRGDAPELWSLESALEHVSRMERVTRDTTNPLTRDEREHFHTNAVDASRGCMALSTALAQAQADAPDLYFAVPVKLAQPVDQRDPERWFRRVIPQSRAEVVDLTRQVRQMNEQINARRSERGLMAQVLPIDGRDEAALARVIVLEPIPRELERQTTELWPLPTVVFVLRRGSLARVPCDTRYLNPASCFSEFTQTIGYDGTLGPQLVLVRPSSVTYWSSFAPVEDGSLFAVGVDSHNHAVVGRYPPGDATPELRPIGARVDALTTIIALEGGPIAIFPTDGSAWVSGGDLEFALTPSTPPPMVARETERGVEHGIVIEGHGTLSMFGSEEFGWTSRFAPTQGEQTLVRVIDAHHNVTAIPVLRALADGKAAAVLQRAQTGQDAIVVSSDYGRTWLAQ